MDTMIDLAKRAVACEKWRWLPGMRTIARHLRDGESLRVVGLGTATGAAHTAHFGPSAARRTWVRNGGCIRSGAVLPDITDPATLGCLLALVREALGDPRAFVMPDHADGITWRIHSRKHPTRYAGKGTSEVAALVDALERAK